MPVYLFLDSLRRHVVGSSQHGHSHCSGALQHASDSEIAYLRSVGVDRAATLNMLAYWSARNGEFSIARVYQRVS